MQLLLELQADPDIEDIQDQTPLDLAIAIDWQEGIEILKGAGACFSKKKHERESTQVSLYMG